MRAAGAPLSHTREGVCDGEDEGEARSRRGAGSYSSQGRRVLEKVVCLVQARREEKSGHFAVDMRHACILETSDANGRRREGNWTGTALPGASHQVDLSNLVMHAGYVWDRF
jgi:hypothetical protein